MKEKNMTLDYWKGRNLKKFFFPDIQAMMKGKQKKYKFFERETKNNVLIKIKVRIPKKYRIILLFQLL